MKTYTITLPDEFAAFLNEVVERKLWPTADYAVLAALARLEDEVREIDALTPEEVAAIRAMIPPPMTPAERSERRDAFEVLDELDASLADPVPLRP